MDTVLICGLLTELLRIGVPCVELVIKRGRLVVTATPCWIGAAVDAGLTRARGLSRVKLVNDWLILHGDGATIH